MPFTFSHPAVLLPLAYLPKRWVSVTGLIIGSLTPDFEYFLRMQLKSEYSHTLSGIFWFDLPLGIFLAIVFHSIVRDPLFENLPFALKSRVSSFKALHWMKYAKANWIAVVSSILIGAASHVIWDNFTHHHGYFVERIALLKQEVALFGFTIPMLKITQHSSTLLGGIGVLYAVFKLPVNEQVDRQPVRVKYWGTFISIAGFILGLRFLTGLHYRAYGHVIVTFITAVGIAAILTPLLLKNTQKLKKKK